jgi:serine-type D-Ala-D-Ala carboxypeptidase/endopeptidase (penicillin-binding protein 4)
MKRAWQLAALLLLGIIPLAAAGIWWQHARDELAAADKGAGPTTGKVAPASQPLAPLLSARRTPGVLATDIRRRSYAAALAPVVRSLPKDGTCFVVSVDGAVVLDAAGTLPVVPASNLKLFTAAVALDVLGPDYVYTTSLNGVVQGDTVQGDLYVVGGGDPLLATADYLKSNFGTHAPFNTTDFAALAKQLKALGIAHVTGRIIGDDSRYDAERYDPDWGPGVANSSSGAGPTSALLLNDGWTPKGNGSPAGILARKSPTILAAQTLRDLLVQNGVSVGAGVDAAPVPAGLAVLTRIQSVPMSGVVQEMLTNSDNNTAEALLREIGFKVAGQGTRAAGAAAVVAKLAEWGIQGVTMVDGSGLDRANRVTCQAMVDVLAREGPTGPFHDGLSVAGKTGTLKGEFADTPFVDKLYGKTGTLSVAKALSGYYPTATGIIEFALIVNVPPGPTTAESVAKPLWALLPGTMSSAPPGPAVETLAPGGS